MFSSDASRLTRAAPPRPAPPPLQGCGFYPLVGRVLPVAARDAKAKAQLLTRKNERVRIHPCSVNSK